MTEQNHKETLGFLFIVFFPLKLIWCHSNNNNMCLHTLIWVFSFIDCSVLFFGKRKTSDWWNLTTRSLADFYYSSFPTVIILSDTNSFWRLSLFVIVVQRPNKNLGLCTVRRVIVKTRLHHKKKKWVQRRIMDADDGWIWRPVGDFCTHTHKKRRRRRGKICRC